MPFYYTINSEDPSERRAAENLLELKKAFGKEGIPERTVDETLLLATWNIREFGGTKYGGRKKESLFYIAEIISRFDLVAVQEVRSDLTALKKLMEILGGWWKFVVTDVTAGSRGNSERMAFLYNTKKISFGGLAGEIVIPPTKEKGGKEYKPAEQLARTPFVVGFRSGWFKFQICTTHILYGKAVAEDPERVKEIELLSEFLAKKAEDKNSWAKNLIMLGDYNIFSTEDITLKAIKKAGFKIPKALQSIPSNVPQDKFYDQIAFIAPEVDNQLESSKAGVFNFFKYIYRENDGDMYAEEMGEKYKKAKNKKNYYKTWRTYKMSDHLPMWIELKIDFGEEYLKSKSKEPKK